MTIGGGENEEHAPGQKPGSHQTEDTRNSVSKICKRKEKLKALKQKTDKENQINLS